MFKKVAHILVCFLSHGKLVDKKDFIKANLNCTAIKSWTVTKEWRKRKTFICICLQFPFPDTLSQRILALCQRDFCHEHSHVSEMIRIAQRMEVYSCGFVWLIQVTFLCYLLIYFIHTTWTLIPGKPQQLARWKAEHSRKMQNQYKQRLNTGACMADCKQLNY